jgi:uncharacterized membrane protein YfcA
MAQLAAAGLSPLSICRLTAAFFLSGIAGGVSGFAFTVVAASVLWLLPPSEAIPLIILLSACNHLLSLGMLRREVAIHGAPEGEQASPFIVGGLAGLPFGLIVLRSVPASVLTAGLGALLVAYGLTMLAQRDRLRISSAGWSTSVAVGAAGGVLAGAAGVTSMMPTAYLGLRGVGKSTICGIVLCYTLTLQVTVLGIIALTNPAVFSSRFWLLSAVAFPAVVLGSAVGVSLYRRINSIYFRLAMFPLMTLQGLSLIARATI